MPFICNVQAKNLWVPGLVALSLVCAGCSEEPSNRTTTMPEAEPQPDPAPQPEGEPEGEPAAMPEPEGEPDFVLAPRFEPLAQALEEDLQTNNATGVSVAVWIDGEVTWVGGFGTIDPLEERRPNEETQFMIGSNSKKITAITLLQRIAAGDATLDTTLGDVLPDLEFDLAPAYHNTTAHELLSHQGGMFDDIGELTTTTQDAQLREYTYRTLATEGFAWAPPGEFYNYSNANFSMAGLMAETLADTPWADLVEEKVFQPLNMTRTVARKTNVDDNHAPGIGRVQLEQPNARPVPLRDTWESAFARPAAILWSTPSDMMRLAEFLVDGNEDVLPDPWTESIRSPQVEIEPDFPDTYGYGVVHKPAMSLGDDYYEMEVWVHGGRTPTHTSHFLIVPQKRFAISILSNGQFDDFDHSVEVALRTLVELPDPVEQPEPPFEVSVLDELVGTYTEPFNLGDIVVTQEGNGLRVQIPTLDQFGLPYERDLERVSTRNWNLFADNRTIPMRFVNGQNGQSYMANRYLVATRNSTGKGTQTTLPFRPLSQTPEQLHRFLARVALSKSSSMFFDFQ